MINFIKKNGVIIIIWIFGVTFIGRIFDAYEINKQHQEIVKLQLDLVELKRELTAREDFLYRELQTLAYETDILSQNVQELSK